ncbi:Bax inhibitor-1 family protein [Vibrio sp. D431a]|uniref:Bax inhibitor-1 family protein n=1 Tax=Vibrio sp. D431a TaxID=2837388 RepID=UPI002553FCEA|nr:Bax inhibitor-1 family protein [Vibrio sp. D431a]MDK9790639.1 Bax inhibitor-1 family protein [Vibrio sp. D431a]
MYNNQLKVVSRSTFNIYLSLLVLATFAVYFSVGFSLDPTIITDIGFIPLMAGSLLTMIVAVFMCNMIGNIPIQLTGLFLLGSIMGAISSPWLAMVDKSILVEAGGLTLIAAAIMSVLSAIYPNFFIRIRGILMAALIALILVSIASIFLFEMDMTMYHFAALIIFLGFLGYDFVQARSLEPTISNAIVLAASLFIDLLNILRHIYELLED